MYLWPAQIKLLFIPQSYITGELQFELHTPTQVVFGASETRITHLQRNTAGSVERGEYGIEPLRFNKHQLD